MHRGWVDNEDIQAHNGSEALAITDYLDNTEGLGDDISICDNIEYVAKNRRLSQNPGRASPTSSIVLQQPGPASYQTLKVT